MQSGKVAVIGAGTIGTGLAVDLAMHGYDVVLTDVTQDVLDQARTAIGSDLRTYRMLVPEYRDADDKEIMDRITFAADIADVAGAGFVVENITEDYDAKVQVYEELSAVCGPQTFYGANTSCISITKLANHIPDPSRMMGMHFMNPVPVT